MPPGRAGGVSVDVTCRGCAARLKAFGPRLRSFNTKPLQPIFKPASPARQSKRAAPFYLAPQWRGLIASIIAARGRSQECGRTKTRIFGDHIKELRDGGDPFDPLNIMLLCGSCHTLKTNREQSAGAKIGAVKRNKTLKLRVRTEARGPPDTSRGRRTASPALRAPL